MNGMRSIERYGKKEVGVERETHKVEKNKEQKFSLGSLTWVGLLTLLVFGSCHGARADDPMNLEFKGALVIPPPCVINNDGTILTDFGEKVGIRKVASGIYRKTIDINLRCEESSQAWQLMLTVTGNAASFDSENTTVVTAEQADLGIRLLLGGTPMALGIPVKVNASEMPTLESMLVQRPGTELQEGPFTATATLLAEYQ